jgi:hypothetical protein
MTREALLAEVDELLRTTPSITVFGGDHNDEALPWVGRAAAAIEKWDVARGVFVWTAVDELQTIYTDKIGKGLSTLKALLWQARADLRLELGLGQKNIVVAEGQMFDYFDEVRKAIETASGEIYFVDPYLDAEFVSRYLPLAASGVAVRLLGQPKKMTTLLPAVELFAKQSGTMVAVRSSEKLHDRFLFVDRTSCYLSGASFKDGARNAPATWTQIGDAFPAMWETYERFWKDGKVERS